MPISIDYGTKVISVPQADLTLVSGTIYRCNTETQFRQIVNALMASAEGMPFDTPINHNTEVVVAGVTYARTIELINNYTVQFTPDSQWTVILEGSNNNIFDVENGILVQNQVQVIPTNSAGLQVVTTGSGLSAAQDQKLTETHAELVNIEGSLDHSAMMKLIGAALAGKLSGAGGTTITIRDMNDTKDRIVAEVDSDGNRLSVTLDYS